MSAQSYGNLGGAPSAVPVAPVQQKARFNVYTVMLILAFLCMCVATGMVYTELSRFGPFPQWKSPTTAKP